MSLQLPTVTFLDTSVLVCIVQVPGMEDPEVLQEFRDRVEAGEQFLLSTTAIIETGNHIEQSRGARRSAAERMNGLIRAAASGEVPFVLHEVAWDKAFLHDLMDGSALRPSFVDASGDGRLGAGDLAILVERDHYIASSSRTHDDVKIWTLDANLAAQP